jgi:Gpi18-like mannosyltransferase
VAIVEKKEVHPLSNEALLAPFRRISRDDWLVMGWALALKLTLFVLGAKAFLILDDKRLKGWYASLELWNRWDAQHFLQVAQIGYAKGPHLVIYPLFPYTVRVLAWIIGDYFMAALLVSTAALIAAVLLFRRLLEIDYSPLVAQRAIWFFLIFPTAYFLQIGYSESLFMALVFGAILAARRDRWWIAGLVGGLAAMTRANGIGLLPVLAVEAGHQLFIGRKWRWHWLWLGLVPAGCLVYLLINLHVGGNLFAFLETRRQIFRTSPAWPWVGIHEAINNLQRHPNQAEMVGAQELFFVGLTFVCAIISWFKLRPVYAAWITVNWIGFASLSFIQSAPRYTLACFPIFILLALLGKSRFWLGAITAWSLLFYAIFATLFARGWWAF